MAVGSHGMTVWIDSHTEDYFGQGDRGQRLAGTVLPVAKPESGVHGVKEELALDNKSNDTVISVFDVSEEDRWVRVAISEEEGRIVVGSNNGTITILDYA
jgi:hypothetical protein